MGRTKQLLRDDKVALGTWIMVGHPVVAEICAGEGFDWVCLDMEHTATDMRAMMEVVLAVRGSDCDLLVRMPDCDAALAKIYLDAGASGLVVPFVNTADMARKAVSIAKYPPEGMRGAALSRASDYGRNFSSYYSTHNQNVVVIVMLEHIDAVENIDDILSVPGIDGTFIGPYDLSASLGLAGQLDHPEVAAAQEKVLDACRRHGIPAGIHCVPMRSELVQQRIDDGYRFIACSMDTEMLMHGCREILKGTRRGG